MSNLIVLISLPVHGRRKSAHRVGFPFVTVLSSLPGNTLHSSHNRSFCESGYCGWACYADNPPSFQSNACKYQKSRLVFLQTMSNKQAEVFQWFRAFVLTHSPFLCSSTPNLRLRYIWRNYCNNLPYMSRIFTIVTCNYSVACWSQECYF